MNINPLTCVKCGLQLLSANQATKVAEVHPLKVSVAGEAIEYEEWWIVPAIPRFDNITVSRPDAEGYRYFSCADCEKVIVGFSAPANTERCFVACKLVNA